MNPTDLHDHFLEARLRAVLAERAETVTGPIPALPDPVPNPDGIAIAPRPDAPGRHIARWVAVAVAVVVLGGTMFAVATRDDTGPDDPRPAVDQTSTTLPSSVVLTDPALPPMVRLDVVTPLATSTDARAPQDVALDYLVDRLGGGVESVERELRSDLRLGTRPTVGQLVVAISWTSGGSAAGGAEALPGGTIYLRPERGRWAVVAVVTDGISLRSSRRILARFNVALRVERALLPAVVGLDLLTPEGRSLGRSANPMDGTRDAVETWEATPDTEAGPVIVRASVSGGRTFGITEVVFDPSVPEGTVWMGDTADSRTRGAIGTFLEWAVRGPGGSGRWNEGSDPNVVTVDWQFHDSIRVEVDRQRTIEGWVVTDLRDPANTTAPAAARATTTWRGQVESLELVVPEGTASVEAIVDVDGTWRRIRQAFAPARSLRGEPSPPPGFAMATVAIDPPAEIDTAIVVGRDADGDLTTLYATDLRP